MTIDPAATVPAAIIEQQVAAATSLDDLPAIVKALTDRVQAGDARDAEQETRIVQATGIVVTLQSQMLWICSGCILFGGAIGYVATKVIG